MLLSLEVYICVKSLGNAYRQRSGLFFFFFPLKFRCLSSQILLKMMRFDIIAYLPVNIQSSHSNKEPRVFSVIPKIVFARTVRSWEGVY